MNDWKPDVRWRPNTGIIRHEPLMPVPHKNVNLLVTYAEAQQEHEAMMWKKMNDKRRREYGICTALCYLHFMRVEYSMKLARDAVDTLAKRKDIYRHEVKRTCRRIVDEVARLNAWMYNVIQKERYIEGYDHFVDTFSDHMKEKYDALRYCMMQACKPCLADPALYAQLECTRIVAELADACRKGDMEKYKDYSYIKGIYAYNTETLIPLLCSLEELIKKRIFIRGSKDVNLNKDEYVCRCVNAVTDRFRDGKGLVKLLEEKW